MRGAAKSKCAVITGITGQDGSYLAELLLMKGYRVVGAVRRCSTGNRERIAHLLNKVELVEADLLDEVSLTSLLQKVKPDEIYNLAAQTFVPASWAHPNLTAEVTAMGVSRMLGAFLAAAPKAKFYQASSSEMFGKGRPTPRTETSPFHPRSPYGIAKVFAHHLTVNFRESYGLFAVSGILFNHESPRRGIEFVTRKITDAVARIKLGLASSLTLGNLEARRDWGYAGDYVRAIWLMLQQEAPKDYVIGTGTAHSVREFCELAFGCVGLNYRDYVTTDPSLLRPTEADTLLGDASRAVDELGWKPTVGFEEMIEMMVRADLKRHRIHASSHLSREEISPKRVIEYI